MNNLFPPLPAPPPLDDICRQLESSELTLTSLNMTMIQRESDWATRVGNALVGNTSLRYFYLNLGGTPVTDAEAQSLFGGFSQTKVHHLQFDGGFLVRPIITQMICNGIQSMHHLQCIGMTHLILNGRFAPPATPFLSVLEITKVECSEEAATGLAALIRGSELRTLEIVSLSTTDPARLTQVWQVLLDAISETQSITKLALDGFSIQQLQTMTPTFSRLLSLRLVGPNDQGVAISMLSRNILSTANLSDFYLSSIHLGREDVGRLVEGIHNSASIQRFSCSDANLDPDGAVLICRALLNHPSVDYLGLCNNSGIGYKGLQRLAVELAVSRPLNVVDVDLSCFLFRGQDPNQSMTPIKLLEKKQAEDALLQTITQNHQISLTMDENGFSDEFKTSFQFYNIRNRYAWPWIASNQTADPLAGYHALSTCSGFGELEPSLLFFYLTQLPWLVNPRPGTVV